MDVFSLFQKYPALAKMAVQYPKLKSLAYMLDKRAIEIDLADLKRIQEVFDIPGVPNESHVERLRTLMSKSTLDDVADLFQSPQAAVKIVQFFVPNGSGQVASADDDEFQTPLTY